jgi:two-component system, cell cycle sensor histidine kinase and response regulator CckA
LPPTSLVKDVTTRTSTGSLRRQIVLRPPGQSSAETPLDHDGSLLGPAPTDVTSLQDELAKCHASLEQWARAEVEWSQQRRLFQIMTDNVSDLIVLLDHQGHRTWNNPAFSHLSGYSPQELAGTHALTEAHPDDQVRALEALTQSLEKGSTNQFEFRMQKKDGDWISLQAETIGVLDPEGKVESVVLLACDMTEKHKLSEALALASTKATAAGLVEGMARDFDQILTNVVGNLTIAKNLNGPHNAIAVRLNEIERSLQRARDLIEQMFSISPEQGQPKVRISLEQAVQGPVAEVLRGTMVRAEYLFPRNLPEIDVDEEAFSHAIRNIVTNSAQAMDKGVIRFSAESVPQTQFSYRHDLPLKIGDYVCLHIQDQGHGISEKAMSRIFEPYFTTRSGSQGLGLTTALASVQRMGGTILVISTPGVGTTVSIYLPTSAGASTPASKTMLTGTLPRTATAPLPNISAPALGTTGGMPKLVTKRRILLMDDEQMILDIVSRMLRHLGYDVVTCVDGSQAIAAFAKAKSQNEPFDVVMMDLVIPNGVGGQDAVHTIKKIDPTAKVIASSGHLEHAVMQDHKKFGFNAVLEKPYKLEKLQQVIETVANTPAS